MLSLLQTIQVKMEVFTIYLRSILNNHCITTHDTFRGYMQRQIPKYLAEMVNGPGIRNMPLINHKVDTL